MSLTNQHFLTYLNKKPLSPGFLDPPLPPLLHSVIPPHHHSRLAEDPYSRSCIILGWGGRGGEKKNEEKSPRCKRSAANRTAGVSSSQTFGRHAVRVLKALCFNAAGERCLSAEQRRFLAAGEEGSPERSSPSGIDRRLTGWLWGEKKDSSTRLNHETSSGLCFQNKMILRPSQNVAWPMNLVVAGAAQYAHVQSFFVFVFFNKKTS